jgi:hypothetical protein
MEPVYQTHADACIYVFVFVVVVVVFVVVVCVHTNIALKHWYTM